MVLPTEPTEPGHDTRTSRRRAGDAAEAVACRHLESAGLVALERQYLRRIGELDLVMVEPGTGTIVFVEVRYRADARRGGALASVTAAKRRRLGLTAAAWLQRHADPRRAARIDLVGLSPADVAAAPRAPGDDFRTAIVEGYRVEWLRGTV